MKWLYLLLTASVAIGGARMLLRPRSFVGTGRLDATDPRTVRLFGWFFLFLGVATFGGAITSLVKG